MPSRRSIRRIVLAAGVVLAVAVFVPPMIKLTSFRKSIVEAISGGLGRQVSVREVRLRLFPQPGLQLEGLVVQDDPAFSAEPVLHAEEVTAILRWSSLWRWRPEISSLTLRSPTGAQPWSLNVVRRQDGQWNLQSLLLRASQTPAAPTTKLRPEARLRFPYIEGDGGRINFKSGVEKKVYALSEADFALWLASENEWNMRLRARPMRSDASLSDTGTVEISGAFGRAPRLDQTPLRLRLSLRAAQLGQLTRLVYGRDHGWRGSVNLAADLSGTPQDLKLSGAGSIDDFRRYDISLPDTLRLAANCTAQYRWQAQELSQLDCRMQDGELALRGSITGVMGLQRFDLALVAEQLPMAELARLARHAKFALPPDLTAAGALDAEFAYRTGPDQQGWAGAGSTSDFVLRSGVLGQELKLGAIKFEVAPEKAKAQPKSVGRRRSDRAAASAVDGGAGLRLVLAPFPVPLGGTAPATVRASFSATDYNLGVEGDAELQRLFRVARGLGLRAPALGASGSAKLDLQIAGNWTGFTPPVATGSMQLRNVTVLLAGVRGPAHVRSANAVLLPDQVQVENLAATFTGNRTAVDGTLVLPRGCDATQLCPVRFDLHSNEISLEELNRLLNPQLQRVPWYRALAGDTGAAPARFAAHGRLRADQVVLKGLELQHVVAQAELRDRKLHLSDIRADTLGGKLRAEWRADFTGAEPVYDGSGTLERVALPQVAALTHDPWASGTGNGSFKLELAGWSAAELAQSALGALDFEWQNGALQHVALDGDGAPLRLKRFTGHAVLGDRRLEFQQSSMETADGIYVVSGTASLGKLELRLMDRKSRGYAVSGTLEKPHVTALSASEMQAAIGK
ncbi:MAG TPA: AsmA family protein [Terriglobales bacterium]|nr:AsmA family protein [Terriglobales bacterium]